MLCVFCNRTSSSYLLPQTRESSNELTLATRLSYESVEMEKFDTK